MISIIVPIYKVEKYLRECIDGIINQSYKDLEIILVDDGSPDNCPEICEEYAKKDCRIKVLHKKNGGLVSARQAGLKAATGDYIGFVDGDDRISRDMYMVISEKIEKYHPDMVISEFYCNYHDHTEKSCQICDKEYYDKSLLKKEIYPRMLFDGKFYSFGINPNCWSKVFKRELLEKKLPSVDRRIKMGEDAAFTYPCLLDANSICYVDKPLYHYRILQTSMSRGYDKELYSIILLPYFRLAQVNKTSCFDMSEQLSYYLIYLVNFLIRNEAKGLEKKRENEVLDTLKAITDNSDVVEAAKRIDMKKLPLHIKIITRILKKKEYRKLYLYAKGLKLYLTKGR